MNNKFIKLEVIEIKQKLNILGKVYYIYILY